MKYYVKKTAKYTVETLL